ncbi:MAG TPA: tetratricopeptide repeat protein [bacterium]|nr:tetratricopeptide repeat protein [bacterium]
MRSPVGQVVGLCVAAVVAFVTTAGAAVPPYADTVIHPTEAEFQQSIAVYQQAVAASDQDADAYYWLGVAYWQASSLNRNGTISYGADYLQRAIAALERAVSLNPKNIGAWLLLEEAYYTAGDVDKSFDAGDRLNALSVDLSQYTGAMPPAAPRGGPTVVIPPAPSTLAPANPAFRASDFVYAGDTDTKQLYPLSCHLPPMRHLVIFLDKWDAVSRGYTLVQQCP